MNEGSERTRIRNHPERAVPEESADILVCVFPLKRARRVVAFRNAPPKPPEDFVFAGWLSAGRLYHAKAGGTVAAVGLASPVTR